MKVVFKDTLTGEEIQQANIIYNKLADASISQLVSFPYVLSPANQLKYAVAMDEDGAMTGYCIILESKLRLPFLKTAQIQFGPVSISTECDIYLVSEIYRHYKKEGFATLQIQLRFTESEGEKVTRALAEKFAFYQKEDNKNRCTLHIDLDQSIVQIQAGFATVLSKNIRSAINKNVVVRLVSSEEEMKQFAALYMKMGSQRGVIHYTEEYISQLSQFFYSTGNGFLLCAFVDDKMIGGGLFVNQGNMAVYLIGATDPDSKKIPSSHLVLFEAIKFAKAAGKKIFDMGGIGYYAKPGEQIYSINQFKENFTKNRVFYTKVLYCDLNPLKKRLFDFWIW